mgnify:CR=1 FL=1
MYCPMPRAPYIAPYMGPYAIPPMYRYPYAWDCPAWALLQDPYTDTPMTTTCLPMPYA